MTSSVADSAASAVPERATQERLADSHPKGAQRYTPVPVSVLIPTLVRPSLFPLLSALDRQQLADEFEIILIAQPPGRIRRQDLPSDRRIVVSEEPLGMGFGHYRRVAAARASGSILAWIDDDEVPTDDEWLATLIEPIRSGRESVVTAGYHIPLGQGYLADSISWLGLPGGGYPGFEVMWRVDESGYTQHLCTGNFAIRADVLSQAGGFDPRRAKGNEDTFLADRLLALGHRIRYVPEATVLHEARRDMKTFVAWHIERGAAHRSLIAEPASPTAGKVSARLSSSMTILGRTAFTRYFPGVLSMTLLQYTCQLLGFFGLHEATRYG